MVRDPEEQVTRMGVPSEHLNGHAFHTYKVVSADGMYEVPFLLFKFF
jgi:4-hydroxy-tetrahydrodipicolinate reductase